MKKKHVSLLLAAAMAASVISGCGNSANNSAAETEKTETTAAAATSAAEETTAAEAAEDTEKNETDEVVIATPRDAVQGSGDAYYCWEGAYVWEALTANNGGVIDPWLAKSWEHNDDCTEWTFNLRDDAYFTDGVQFDADVCLKNIERWGHGITSTYTTLSIEKSLPNLDKMEKVDDFTVKFTFTQPITTLEYVLSDYAIGTGPYKIVDHVESEYVTLERNDNYYGENGKVKTFKIRCIPDAETRVSALKSGEVMGLADNGAITMDAAKNLCDTDSSFEMDSTPSHMTEYIMFNDKNEYLADKRMREAFNLATDRDSICSVIYGGLLQPAYSFLSTQSTFHLDIQGTYDMEQAKALAKEVLGDKTVDMTMIIRSSTASDYNCKAVAEYLKQVYAELGVNINIEIVDSSLYKERQQEGSYDMTLTVFGINNADPTSTFKQYFASEGNSNKTLNYNYYNEKIDELVAKAPTIADVEERSKIYDEIQQELFDDSACVPICYQINVNIHNKAITHYAGKTFGVGLPTISWVK